MDTTICRREPVRVAEDTWLVRQVVDVAGAAASVPLNSMVITGAEPVVVDAGPPMSSAAWLEDAFSIVDPGDVRWIFVSHDDPDHAGNLPELLVRCPGAVVAASRPVAGRIASRLAVPAARLRVVGAGDRISAGDRGLVAVVPPVYDDPATLGLFDSRTGVYWAADAFAAPADGDDEPAGWMWLGPPIAPWHRRLVVADTADHLDRLLRLDPSVVASAHGPLLRGARLERVLSATDAACSARRTRR